MTITLAAPDLTAIAAWVGALAGIGALIWQFTTWRHSAHRVKVSRSQAWFSYPNGSFSPDLMCITARNVGSSPVTVTSWGVSLGWKRENLNVVNPLPGSTPLPHRLEPGAEMNVHIEARHLREARAEHGVPFGRMRGWVRLATGEQVWASRGLPVSDVPA